MKKHLIKPVIVKGQGQQYYCEDCETVYPEDDIRAGICPLAYGVTCNRCLDNLLKHAYEEHVGDVYGLTAQFDTGYLSEPLEDGYLYRFRLCESCLVDLFETFKKPPERRAYLGGLPGEHRWHDDLQFEAKKGKSH